MDSHAWSYSIREKLAGLPSFHFIAFSLFYLGIVYTGQITQYFWQLFLQSFFCLPTLSFCLDYNYKDIRPLHFFPWVPGTPVFFHQFALISLCFSYCSIFKVVDLLYNLNFLVRLASQFFILDTEFFISAHPRGLLPEQPRLFSGMCWLLQQQPVPGGRAESPEIHLEWLPQAATTPGHFFFSTGG